MASIGSTCAPATAGAQFERLRLVGREPLAACLAAMDAFNFSRQLRTVCGVVVVSKGVCACMRFKRRTMPCPTSAANIGGMAFPTKRA